MLLAGRHKPFDILPYKTQWTVHRLADPVPAPDSLPHVDCHFFLTCRMPITALNMATAQQKA